MDLDSVNAPVLPLAETIPTAADARKAAIRGAAEQFESVFLAQMIAPMFDGLGEDELFGGGPSTKIYRSMMVQEYGKAIARTGGVGIADAVEREILKLQELKE
jgi:Rod binding domain-containing protein